MHEYAQKKQNQNNKNAQTQKIVPKYNIVSAALLFCVPSKSEQLVQ
jgi:hypothetical protein